MSRSRTVMRLMMLFSWVRMESVRASSAVGVVFDVFACVADVTVYQGLQRAIKERRVDLPAPFGPISAVMPPSGMSRLTSFEDGVAADGVADVADGNHRRVRKWKLGVSDGLEFLRRLKLYLSL